MNVSGNVHGAGPVVELTHDEENYLEERLEERFREETEQGNPKWIEYVGDLTPADVARIFGFVARGKTPEALLAVERIRDDYVEHRLVTGYHERAEELARMTWCEGSAI